MERSALEHISSPSSSLRSSSPVAAALSSQARAHATVSPIPTTIVATTSVSSSNNNNQEEPEDPPVLLVDSAKPPKPKTNHYKNLLRPKKHKPWQQDSPSRNNLIATQSNHQEESSTTGEREPPRVPPSSTVTATPTGSTNTFEEEEEEIAVVVQMDGQDDEDKNMDQEETKLNPPVVPLSTPPASTTAEDENVLPEERENDEENEEINSNKNVDVNEPTQDVQAQEESESSKDNDPVVQGDSVPETSNAADSDVNQTESLDASVDEYKSVRDEADGHKLLHSQSNHNNKDMTEATEEDVTLTEHVSDEEENQPHRPESTLVLSNATVVQAEDVAVPTVVKEEEDVASTNPQPATVGEPSTSIKVDEGQVSTGAVDQKDTDASEEDDEEQQDAEPVLASQELPQEDKQQSEDKQEQDEPETSAELLEDTASTNVVDNDKHGPLDNGRITTLSPSVLSAFAETEEDEEEWPAARVEALQNMMPPAVDLSRIVEEEEHELDETIEVVEDATGEPVKPIQGLLGSTNETTNEDEEEEEDKALLLSTTVNNHNENTSMEDGYKSPVEVQTQPTYTTLPTFESECDGDNDEQEQKEPADDAETKKDENVAVSSRPPLVNTVGNLAAQEQDSESPMSVQNLRMKFERKSMPISVLEVAGGSITLDPSLVPLSARSERSEEDSYGEISRSNSSSHFFGRRFGTDDSVSEMSGAGEYFAGGMEGFYRQQQFQKFQERQKLKETWIRYHCDKEEDVVVSLLKQPSAHATVFQASEETGGGDTVAPQKGLPSASNSTAPHVLVDYKNHDYRGFIFLVHNDHGLVLLECSRKKNKPIHWQVPGGHVDEPEFIEAAKLSEDRQTQLLLACKAGAARELFEETGMDCRSTLDRLEPAQLRSLEQVDEKQAVNELKNRLFFFLQVTDPDFPECIDGSGTAPQSPEGSHLKLKLSNEHSGFTFVSEPARAAEMLRHHSGGKCSDALLMAMSSDKEQVAATILKRDQEGKVANDKMKNGTTGSNDELVVENAKNDEIDNTGSAKTFDDHVHLKDKPYDNTLAEALQHDAVKVPGVYNHDGEDLLIGNEGKETEKQETTLVEKEPSSKDNTTESTEEGQGKYIGVDGEKDDAKVESRDLKKETSTGVAEKEKTKGTEKNGKKSRASSPAKEQRGRGGKKHGRNNRNGNSKKDAQSFNTGESPEAYIDPSEMDLDVPRARRRMGLLCCFVFPLQQKHHH